MKVNTQMSQCRVGDGSDGGHAAVQAAAGILELSSAAGGSVVSGTQCWKHHLSLAACEKSIWSCALWVWLVGKIFTLRTEIEHYVL